MSSARHLSISAVCLSAAIRLASVPPTMLLAYVEQCLFPTLRRGDIVVMENPPTHKVAGDRGRQSKVPGQRFGICRSILLTSTLSSCLTANSKRCCARLPRGLSESLRGYSLFRPAAQYSGMCQLLQACWLCFRMTGLAFSPRCCFHPAYV